MSQITSDELDIELEKKTMSGLVEEILQEAKNLGFYPAFKNAIAIVAGKQD